MSRKKMGELAEDLLQQYPSGLPTRDELFVVPELPPPPFHRVRKAIDDTERVHTKMEVHAALGEAHSHTRHDSHTFSGKTWGSGNAPVKRKEEFTTEPNSKDTARQERVAFLIENKVPRGGCARPWTSKNGDQGFLSFCTRGSYNFSHSMPDDSQRTQAHSIHPFTHAVGWGGTV